MYRELRLAIILFLLLPAFSVAQPVAKAILLKGKVVNEKNAPLPYVNVGIPGKSAGTVSDNEGRFELRIPGNDREDSILFSSIGYGSKLIAVRNLENKFCEIILPEDYKPLQQVVVTPRTLKTHTLGNTTKSKFMSGGFSTNDLGSEAGTKIKIKKYPAWLDKVNFHISYNKLDSVKVRLNIYNLEKGKPDKNILPENVIVSIYNHQTGDFSIDVSKYNLAVENDILVALELIEGKGDIRSSIFLSAALLGSPTYYRATSQAKWKIYKGLSIGINVTAEY